ncbi:fungal-specific transcription factor domain-containing protein [Papiliotrema laurentii]|uniref:Fungal-specific transcription factor domain-containing protein n=1 Tax=Papiliotrema laurentii TaxID=5418 RepID=A0AAD9FS99_PAPLA|nr:fungal-specific transcription factor domain-containing protein [Papiliotrema laurentii]
MSPSPAHPATAALSASTSVAGGNDKEPSGTPEASGSSPKKVDGGQKIVQRSRTGVRCDETKPRCERCKIKSRNCIWPEGGTTKKRKRRSSVAISTKSPLEGDLFASLTHDTSFAIPINPFSQPAPPTVHHAFDPSSFLDLLPLLPQTNRFYVPPDFLPKATQPDLFKGLRSNDFLECLIAPRKRAEAMADPGFLKPYFPTIQERVVMRHYLLDTVHVIMAFECPRKPWNPWIEIHAPLAFDHPPGTSPAADALRAAMLAVGAVHMRYRHDSTDQAGAWNVVRVAKAKVLGLVRQRIDAQEAASSALDKGDVELMIAALLSCTIASSLAADDSWHELLTSVVSLVDRLGGASNLIREGTHERMSSFRFMLEQLAIRDVFGCMTTQLSPSILNVAFSPWFFEAEGWSYGDDEWESVERMFGFSRGIVDVIARACTLISKIKRNGLILPEANPDQAGFPLRLPARAVARLTDPPEPQPETSQRDLHAEAEGLMAELAIWDNASTFTPYHPRTLYGNHSYRHAIRIRLLRELFGVPRDDPRVQTSCAAIIELGVEVLSLFGRITWFTWPIIIAAFNLMPGDPSKPTALKLIGEFGQYACFDNLAASRFLAEFYKHEELEGVLTPAQVADRMRSKPFLD